jgi:hypothetical protein
MQPDFLSMGILMWILYLVLLYPHHTQVSDLRCTLRWLLNGKPHLLPYGHVELLIGILSAGNHFAERTAVRKSWMQHKLIKSSHVMAWFFVALVSEDARDVFFSKKPLMHNLHVSYLLQLLDIYFDSMEETT